MDDNNINSTSLPADPMDNLTMPAADPIQTPVVNPTVMPNQPTIPTASTPGLSDISMVDMPSAQPVAPAMSTPMPKFEDTLNKSTKPADSTHGDLSYTDSSKEHETIIQALDRIEEKLDAIEEKIGI